MSPLRNDFGNSHGLVSVKDIRDNTLILEDGSLRKIIMVSGVNISLKSEKEQGMITVAYQNFLNALDFPIEIVVHSRKININDYLEKLGAIQETEPSPLLKNQINEYKEFVSQFVKENAIMGKTFLVIIPWYPTVTVEQTKSALSFLPFLHKNKGKDNKKQVGPEGVDPADLTHNLPQLDQRVDQIAQGLFVIGLDTVVLNDDQLAELLYNFYNPEATERENITLPEEE